MEPLECRTLLSAGDLDPTFGKGGMTTVFNSNTRAVVVQNDGKIIIGGAWLERLNSDGSPDQSFAFGGANEVGFPIAAMVVQPDGRIVVAGGTGAVVRLNSDGSADRSFGAAGSAQSPVALDQATVSLALAPDGKIVEGGLLPERGGFAAAIRFDTDGRIDTSFNQAGFAVRVVAPYEYNTAAVAVQADGKVLVGSGYGSDFAVLRWDVDGSVDTSFGLDGLATTFSGGGDINLGNYTDFAVSKMLVEADGRILVAGPANIVDGTYPTWEMGRLNPDGSVDTSFGTNGVVTVTALQSTHFSNPPYLPGGLAVQSNGDILIGGTDTADVYAGGQHNGPFTIVRYRPDGTPDTTFHIPSVSFPLNPWGVLGPMALAQDGRIVIAGDILPADNIRSSAAGVVRVLGDAPGPVASPFLGHPSIAGSDTIEAENFDNGGEGTGYRNPTAQNADPYRDAVVASASASNGHYVGGTAAGEWLQYTIYVPVTGTYIFQASVASATQGGTFHADIDGHDYTGGLAVPATGGALSWQTIPSHPFDLADGSHVLRVYFDTGGSRSLVGNFDSFQLTRQQVPVPPPGTPDPTFGLQGRQMYSDPTFDSSIEHRVRAVAVQPDGKIILAGSTGPQADQGVGRIFLERLNADGTVDPTFGANGQVDTAVGAVSFASAILLQSDGRIIVGGATEDNASAPTNASFALLRYNPDGTVDKSFGINGVAITDFAGNEEVDSLALAPGGKIVAAGAYFLNPNVGFEIARYNADGSIDHTFNGTGTLSKNLGPTGGNSGPVGLAVQGDGKVVIGAHQQNLFAVYRYNADGTVDTTFGPGGVATAPDYPGTLNKVLLQPDGKILAAGLYATSIVAIRFTADGSRDSSFGFGGGVFANHPVAGLLLEPDGRVVMAGSAGGADEQNPNAQRFVLYAAPSTPPIFDFEKPPFLPTDPVGDNVAEAAAMAPDGSVVVAGDIFFSTHWIGVARYSFAPAPVPGDTDGDGKVDFTDLLAVAQNYASAGAVRSQGDLNTDGLVNFSDLLLLAQNYKKSNGTAASRRRVVR